MAGDRGLGKSQVLVAVRRGEEVSQQVQLYKEGTEDTHDYGGQDAAGVSESLQREGKEVWAHREWDQCP